MTKLKTVVMMMKLLIQKVSHWYKIFMYIRTLNVFKNSTYNNNFKAKLYYFVK